MLRFVQKCNLWPGKIISRPPAVVLRWPGRTENYAQIEVPFLELFILFLAYNFLVNFFATFFNAFEISIKFCISWCPF
jgi:hypothetical protein